MDISRQFDDKWQVLAFWLFPVFDVVLRGRAEFNIAPSFFSNSELCWALPFIAALLFLSSCLMSR